MSIVLALIAAGSFTVCVTVVARSTLRFRGAYAPAFDTTGRR